MIEPEPIVTVGQLIDRLSTFVREAPLSILQENGSTSADRIEAVFLDEDGIVVLDPHGTGYA